MPGPSGRSSDAPAEPWVRTCCLDGWLQRGWSCRRCRRDAHSGRRAAARGIYGGRANDCWGMPSQCACGRELHSFNYASCRSCYWVLTRQLIRRFLDLLGPWTPLHEHIFSFLIEARTFLGDPRGEPAKYRAEDLLEVRLCGLLQGPSSHCAGMQRLQLEGMEGQRAFAMRYSMGDIDWIPSSESQGPDPFHEHVLVWHPPMAPPSEVFSRLVDELARAAAHPLAPAISDELVRALGVLEPWRALAMQGHGSWLAPCVWCGHFAESCCDGVPASSASPGWLCEFRVCSLCRSLFERCRFCCLWTGLPATAGEDAIAQCRRSAVALGRIPREFLTQRRIPFELLPVHFQLDWRSICSCEAREFTSAEARLRWVCSLASRALCKDPPAGKRRLPPRRATHRDLQAEPSGEVPAEVALSDRIQERQAVLRMRLTRLVSLGLRMEPAARAYVWEPSPEFRDIDLEHLLASSAEVDGVHMRAQLEPLHTISELLGRCEARLDEGGLRWHV